jgi:hypothetical protein
LQTVQRIEAINFSIFILLCGASIAPLVSFYIRGYIPLYWLAEDGVYESMGALAVFLGAAIAFWAFWQSANNNRLKRNFWLLFLSIALAVLAGEEVSWGQRMFDIELSQEVMAKNFQGELNLHNSKILNTHNTFLSRLLAQGLLVYLILIPIFLTAFPTAGRLACRLRVPIPGLDIALVALLAKMASTVTLRFIHGLDLSSAQLETMGEMRMSEMLECILEICLLWAACGFLYQELVKRKPGAAEI